MVEGNETGLTRNVQSAAGERTQGIPVGLGSGQLSN